jgi:Carboxypeptidase regulatory-like domain
MSMPKLLPFRLGLTAFASALFCALSLFSQQINSASDSSKPGSTYRIVGVAISAQTGAPLSQARIFLINTKNPRQSASLLTGEDGRFEFTGIPPGKYSLQGVRRGYLPAAYEQHEQYSTAIVTGAGIDTENLRLRLVPMAGLSGSVLDENGEPVRNAQVHLYEESHRGGTTRVGSRSVTGTDDQGTFEFAPLAPGKYFVSATASPWYAIQATAPEARTSSDVDSSLDAAYPMTFYGGSTSSDGAEPITVQAGEHAQAEIRLTAVQAVHLMFHSPPNPEHGYRMPTLQQRVFDSLEFLPVNTISSGSPGTFEMTGVAPGRYTVRAPANAEGQTQEGEMEVKQDGQDLGETRGEPLGQVKLQVMFPADEPQPKQLSIGLQDEKNRTVAVSFVDADGKASFDNLRSGRYSLRVLSQDRVHSVTRMTSSDISQAPNTQLSGAQFMLKAGESQEWTIALASGKTTVEGFVKRDGKPASGIMVVLIPKNPEAHQDLFRRDQSDLDGSFALRSVIPGLYMIVAIEDAWGFDWSKPLLLTRYAEHGQAVTVGELMRGSVTLSDPVQVQPR